ncbi:MAG: gamma-glutamyl-gamma-aminobutyrate hydrolase family protein [Gammaproteobacteria bacterium]
MSRQTKPLIAITGPDHGGTLAWLFTWLAIWRAGGKAKWVTPSQNQAQPEFDGLIIGGGADITPESYGHSLLEIPDTDKTQSWFKRLCSLIFYPLFILLRRLFSVKHYQGLDESRDQLETALLQQALDQHKPVLGICRGMQLINVYFGGTLHQDISTFYSESQQIWSVLPRKSIVIKNDSRLADILQTDRLQVNALHRQSIDQLGDGLHTSAWEPNKVVQAIEAIDKSFILGVQWHPEYLPHQPRQLCIFKQFIQEASR